MMDGGAEKIFCIVSSREAVKNFFAPDSKSDMQRTVFQVLQFDDFLYYKRGMQALHAAAVIIDYGADDMDKPARVRTYLKRRLAPEPFALVPSDRPPPAECDGLRLLYFPCDKTLLMQLLLCSVRQTISDKPVSYKKFASDLRRVQPVALPELMYSGTKFADELSKLIGSSNAIGILKNSLVKTANVQLPILITGESGTGKTFIARLLHNLSSRRKGPFIAFPLINRATDLIDAELFGTVRGAYTGAVDKRGVIAQASGGTLFLDEIGSIPPEMQTKLLLLFDSKRFMPLGGGEFDADVRFLCATNADLPGMVDRGTFRSDLWHRLSLQLIIPPLRERENDALELAKSFAAGYGKSLAADACDKILSYKWPGNVRELRNCVELACQMTDSKIIGADDLILKSLVG